MFHVLISEDAYVDIKDIRQYYHSIQKPLAKKFRQDLSATLKTIRKNPTIFGYRFDDFRSANLKVFPYQVHYIFAVLYSGRRPNYVTQRSNK